VSRVVSLWQLPGVSLQSKQALLVRGDRWFVKIVSLNDMRSGCNNGHASRGEKKAEKP
jgi:hypothetical protein